VAGWLSHAGRLLEVSMILETKFLLAPPRRFGRGLPDFFIPLIRASHPYSAHVWQGAYLDSALGTYSALLVSILVPLAAALAV
jgi:hypothetical protein